MRGGIKNMRVKQEYLEALQKQFCKDFNCKLEDFEKQENIVTVLLRSSQLDIQLT